MSMQSIRKQHTFLFCMVILTFLVVAFVSMLRPIIVGYMVHNGYQLKNMAAFMFYTKIIGIMSVVVLIFSIMRALIYIHFEAIIIAQFQAMVMKRILQLPIYFFDQYTVGDLVHRILWIVSCNQWLGGAQLSVLLSFLSLLVSFSLMLYFDWALSLLVWILIALITTISISASLRILPDLQQHAKRMGHAYGFMLQVLRGISRIKCFAKEPFIESIWSTSYIEGRQSLQNAYNKGVIGYAFFYSAPLLFLLVIFYAALLGLETISPRDFIVFFLGLSLLISSMVSFYLSMSGFIHAIIAYQRLQPIFDTPVELGHISSTDTASIVTPIHINDISFCYPNANMWILRGINCFISSGEHVAFIGLSGSGKSTLLKLLLGFYTPQQGQIEINGKRLQGEELLNFRSNIGVVLQDSQFMPGTILENIIGHTHATEEDVWNVLRSLGLEELMMQFPMGIHTMISQDISVLSGGQKQLLFIARALVGKPKLLLLDEATNALDNQAQEMVTKRINQLQITRITIAHRLSAIKNVDKIFVLDQGTISQSGNYQQLLKDEKGLFYQLSRIMHG